MPTSFVALDVRCLSSLLSSFPFFLSNDKLPEIRFNPDLRCQVLCAGMFHATVSRLIGRDSFPCTRAEKRFFATNFDRDRGRIPLMFPTVYCRVKALEGPCIL